MNFKHFALGTTENSRFINIIRLIFGIICILVAAFWLHYNLNALKTDWSLWITIIFLLGFGIFQILAGLGKTDRFIDIHEKEILLKKNSLLPLRTLKAEELEKIELFPLNTIFFLRNGKRVMLRFGSTFYETNEKVKDEIYVFADTNNIPLEIIEEKI